MSKKYRVSGAKWFVVTLLVVAFGLVSVPTMAKPKTEAVDKVRKVLLKRLERSLLGYDVNMGTKHIIDYYFSPLHAMSAYRELLLWSQANPQNKSIGGDALDIVREGMIAIVRDSGAGLPLLDWKGPGQPISVAYLSTLPRYQEIPEFDNSATLKWTVTPADSGAISPGAIGQSLAVKALMIEMDRSHPGQGNAPLFLASALQELDLVASRMFMSERLAQEVIKEPVPEDVSIKGKDSGRGVQMKLAATPKELGASSNQPASKMKLGPVAEGLYVPEGIVSGETGAWSVKDDRSMLKSQALLLQGLAHLHRLLSVKEVIEPLLADGKAQGRGVGDWQKLIRRTMDVVYASILLNHYDAIAGSFSSEYRISDGGRGNIIFLEDASHLVAAFETLIGTLSRDDPVSVSARKHLLAQAAYVSEALSARQGMPRGLMLKNGVHVRSMMRDLSYPIAVMSILIVADNIAGDGRFREEIAELYESTYKGFWAKNSSIYRAAEGVRVSAYDGILFGNVISWLRRMKSFLPGAADFDQQVRDTIQVVLRDAGLLQGEGPANGEPRTPEDFIRDDVPAFIDTLEDVKASELSAPIQKFVQQVVDQDGDGSPGCRFAGGNYGGAPVIIMQVGVNTPFDLRLKSGNLNYGF